MKRRDNKILGQTAADILRFRATRLAKKSSQKHESNLIKVVAFRLAHETYGIELSHIRFIHPLKGLTVIPGAPDFIAGIINIRGEIISIVDFKKMFDLPAQEQNRHIHVIILQSKVIEFGILADQVLGVTEIREKDIQPSLPTLTGIRQQYIKGVTGDGMVILDGEKILSDKNMVIHIDANG